MENINKLATQVTDIIHLTASLFIAYQLKSAMGINIFKNWSLFH